MGKEAVSLLSVLLNLLVSKVIHFTLQNALASHCLTFRNERSAFDGAAAELILLFIIRNVPFLLLSQE